MHVLYWQISICSVKMFRLQIKKPTEPWVLLLGAKLVLGRLAF